MAFPPLISPNGGCYLKGKLRSVRPGVSGPENELNQELQNISQNICLRRQTADNVSIRP